MILPRELTKSEKELLLVTAPRCAICRGLFAPAHEGRFHPLARTIDHIVPKSRGGRSNAANLQVTHRKCNMDKGDGYKDDYLTLKQNLLAILALL